MICPCAYSTGDYDGNNCPTCSGGGGGVELFGARLTDGSSMMKRASMVDLLFASSSCLDRNHAASATNRLKKAVAWTDEEQQRFLRGLQKLGKGDWRGISRKFVLTKTRTQVASHALKYFLRNNSDFNRGKLRASLSDMVSDSV